MALKKKVIPSKINFVFTNEEHQKIVSFLNLLNEINRESKSKGKGQETKSKDSYLIVRLFFLLTTLYLNNQYRKNSNFKSNMVDTIVFHLTKDMYHISDPSKFEPAAHWASGHYSPSLFGIKSKQNSSKKDLIKGIYKPYLTLYTRVNPLGGHDIFLKIELSLPKFFFGNNFDEMRAKDFKVVVEKLSSILEQMGIIITSAKLARAPVSAIHYSKNILLTDGSTPYHFINKIKEANIKLSLDTNQTDYRNDGHSYKWHCNAYEIVFYDKIRDLEKAKQSDKRAIEKDSALQLNIFNKFETRNKMEILRMEVRLNKRQKIKQLYNKLQIKSDLTFKSLFKPTISKKVLLHYVDELESKRLAITDYRKTNDKALLTDLIFHNPQLGPKQIFQRFGLKKILETVNARELRVMFASYDERNWYRLMAEAKKIALPITNKPLAVIREHISKFRTLRLK